MKSALHFFGNLAPMLTGLITAPLTARAVGVEGRGQIVIVTTIFALFVVVGTFGLGWTARDGVANDPDSVLYWRGLAANASLAFLPVGFIVGLGLAAWLGLGRPAAVITIVLYIVGALASRRAVDANALISIGHSHLVGAANAIYSAGLVAAVIVLYVTGQLTVAAVIGANLFGVACQLVTVGVGVRIATRGRVPELKAHAQRLKLEARSRPGHGNIVLGLKSWGAQLVDASASKWDTLLIAAYASKPVVGLYSVPAIAVQVGYSVYTTITQRSFTRFPRHDPERRLVLLYQVCMLVAVLLAAGTVVGGHLLIVPIFGSDFRKSLHYLVPAAIVILGLAGFAPAIQDIARRGRLYVLLPLLGPALVPAFAAGLAGVDPAMDVDLLGVMLVATCMFYVRIRCGRACLRIQGNEIRALFV